MSIIKLAKDSLIKLISGKHFVPPGLVELQRYFRHYGNLIFKFEKGDETTVAVSTNFRYGSIVTSGKTPDELDKNIKDAILTSFEIPSSFAKDAQITRVGDSRAGEYAPA